MSHWYHPAPPVQALSTNSSILPTLLHLAQNSIRLPHCLHGRRRPTIDRRLHNDLPYLNLAYPIPNRPAHMHPKLRRAVQRNQHPQVQQAALFAVQARAVPYVAPGVFGDEVLEGPGEGRVVGRQGVVDVCVTEDGAAGLEALCVGFGVGCLVGIGVA